MRFVVTTKHSTDHCWAREENREKADEWVEGMDERAEEAGVDIHDVFIAPNEHVFYLILEADDFASVSAFLGPPFLQDHDADVVPVMTVGEVDEMLEK